MKVLLVNDALLSRGGSESYLQTIAWALRRLGHTAVFYTDTLGPFSDDLMRDGFEVLDSIDALPGDIDVIHGQHVAPVAKVRTRLADTPLLFATHSWFVPIEDPLVGFHADAFLAFNDITLARLRAHPASAGKPIHRLRQPIDITFQDSARSPISTTPRTALALSRSQKLSLLQVRAACRKLNIELVTVGKGGDESSDARLEMLAVDIVFASGRGALEAMAAGKAVFIIDESTIAGWVTADSYDALEADGFTGVGSSPRLRALDEDLDKYFPSLGRDARRLAVHNHSAQRHVAQLVVIYGSLQRGVAASSDLEESARLTAENMGLQARLVSLEWLHAKQTEEIRTLHKSAVWLASHPRETLQRVRRRIRGPGAG